MTLPTVVLFWPFPAPPSCPKRCCARCTGSAPNIYEGEAGRAGRKPDPDLRRWRVPEHAATFYIGNVPLPRGRLHLQCCRRLVTGYWLPATGRLSAMAGAIMARVWESRVDVIGLRQTQPLRSEPDRGGAARQDKEHRIRRCWPVARGYIQVPLAERHRGIATLRWTAAGHPALLMADWHRGVFPQFGGCDRFEMDAWALDVMVAGQPEGA